MNTATEIKKDTKATLEEAFEKESSLSRKPKRPLAWGLAALVAIGGSVGGGQMWLHAMSVEETDDAYITGRIHRLSARVGGTVTRLEVDDNEHVKRGQALVQIDPTDYAIDANTAKAAAAQAELKTEEIKSGIIADQREAEAKALDAQSAVASARAGVDRAKAILDETHLGVKLAMTQVTQRKAELTRCQADFERYRSLVEDRAATRQSFDNARQDKVVAEANLQAAKESLKQAKARVLQAEQSVADAQATVVRAKAAAVSAAAAEAELDKTRKNLLVQKAAATEAQSRFQNANTQLSYTRVVAPVTGRVGNRTVEVGQQVEKGQALMSIVSDEKWIIANFKETQLSRIRPGQKVDIRVDAFPDAHFTGKVESISPASGAKFALLPPDNATGNFTKVVQRVPLKITFDPASIKGYENLLAPGMSVIPEVHVGGAEAKKR